MPEMKLKQQNLLHNFKSTIKNIETKLTIIEKLDNCTLKSPTNDTKSNEADNILNINTNIKKVKI